MCFVRAVILGVGGGQRSVVVLGRFAGKAMHVHTVRLCEILEGVLAGTPPIRCTADLVKKKNTEKKRVMVRVACRAAHHATRSFNSAGV